MAQNDLKKACRAGWRRWIVTALLGGVVALNLLAFAQTWTMTHYSPSGTRTPRPEELSLLDKVGAVVMGVNVPRPANQLTPADTGLPYETRYIPATGAGGGFLEAWHVGPVTGTMGIVIMFPGYATSKEALLAQAGEFYRLGWAALLVDFRGAGGSSGSATTLGAKEAGDVLAALDYARREWPGTKVALYGVSMGAAAVLRAYALDGARPDALILESPFDSLLNTVRNRFDAMGLPAFPFSELMVFWGGIQHGFDGFAHNPADYAVSVRCPTLLLYGQSDPRVTPEQSLAIYARLNPEGSRESVAFAGVGHQSLIAGDRDLWVESVDRFLTALASH